MKYDEVWNLIRHNAAAVFETMTGLKFQLIIGGNGIVIVRDGRIISRRLTRCHLNRAIDRCPLQQTTEIRDCLGSSYLFGILMDNRIRNGRW